MKTRIGAIALAAGFLMIATSYAQAPATAPAGSTGMCKDGSYYSGATRKGACKGHKGVKDWYASASAAQPKVAAAAAAPAAAAPAAAAATTAAVAAPTMATKVKESAKEKFTPPATAVAGGGPGLVWVNTSSKTYHCQSDKWYGRTKEGAYMSEADAKAKGNHADHGKACQ